MNSLLISWNRVVEVLGIINGIHSKFKNVIMSEVTLASRLRDSAQPIRMQVSFDIFKLSYILKRGVNPINILSTYNLFSKFPMH